MTLKIKDQFMKYVGCPVLIDTKTGETIIISSGKIVQMPFQDTTESPIGSVAGVKKIGRRLQLLVMYGAGQVFAYDRRFIKII